MAKSRHLEVLLVHQSSTLSTLLVQPDSRPLGFGAAVWGLGLGLGLRRSEWDLLPRDISSTSKTTQHASARHFCAADGSRAQGDSEEEKGRGNARNTFL